MLNALLMPGQNYIDLMNNRKGQRPSYLGLVFKTGVTELKEWSYNHSPLITLCGRSFNQTLQENIWYCWPLLMMERWPVGWCWLPTVLGFVRELWKRSAVGREEVPCQPLLPAKGQLT